MLSTDVSHFNHATPHHATQQLAKQCREQGLLPAPPSAEEAAATATTKLSKDEMIARLVAHKDEQGGGPLRVTDGSTPGVAEEEGPQPKKARRALTRESLPSNLYAMSIPQLKSVCAAHGFAPKSVTQAGIIQVDWCGGSGLNVHGGGGVEVLNP